MQKQARVFFTSLILAIGLMSNTSLHAADSDPKLLVSGHIRAGVDALTFKDLAAFPQHQLTEKIQASDTSSVFEGPYLADVLASLDANATNIHAQALDDYAADIPVDMIAKYQPILAIRRDGKQITVNDLGPFLIMWPFSEHPEIDNDQGWTWAAWQLRSLLIQ